MFFNTLRTRVLSICVCVCEKNKKKTATEIKKNNHKTCLRIEYFIWAMAMMSGAFKYLSETD